MAENQKTYKPNISDIIYENFEDEVVLINLKTGIYYSLNFIGKKIWECLEKNVALDEMIDVFSDLYETDTENLKKEVKSFMAQLEKENLVVTVDSPPERQKKSPDSMKIKKSGNRDKFDSPVLKKYTDQQELLLLDPIHEVSDLGWPDKGEEKPDSD